MNTEATVASQEEPKTGFTRRLARPVISLAAVFILGPMILSTGARSHWVCDLASHFYVQYALLLLPVVIICIAARRWLAAIAFTVIWIAALLPVAAYFSVPQQQKPAVDPVRLLTFNVRTSNDSFEEVVAYIRNENPDVIALLEIDQRWRRGLDALHEEFPHSRFQTRDDNFGICIFSKIKWEEVEVFDTNTTRSTPSISARFVINDQPVHYVATHPIPPMSRHNATARNEQLLEIAGQLDQTNERIFTGDFNLTPWSPWFEEVVSIANVRDAALGFGVAPTWYRLPTLMGGIKIDHFLISEAICVKDHRVGPDLGSDHRPVVVDLLIGATDDD